jgi:hypothetical protein
MRMIMGLTGIALVVGFFMPWIDVGGLHGVSGYDLVKNEHLATSTRLILALCPLGGALLALAAFARSAAAAKISVAMGAGVLGYTTFKLAYGFLKVTGWGLWMVLAGGAVALVLGLSGRKTSPAA